MQRTRWCFLWTLKYQRRHHKDLPKYQSGVGDYLRDSFQEVETCDYSLYLWALCEGLLCFLAQLERSASSKIEKILGRRFCWTRAETFTD
jgi:hypothetical protein